MRMSIGYKPFSAGGAALATFDPLNKTSFATLSGGNLVITWAGSEPDAEVAGAAGTVDATSGKRIFGFGISDTVTSFIGLNPSGTIGGGPAGIEGPGALWVNAFGIFIDGAPVAAPAPFGAGDTVELIYDVATYTVWFAVNGTPISGDPVAGTGGYTMAANNPQACAGLADTGTITGNFGQTPFSYSGAGVTAWG